MANIIDLEKYRLKREIKEEMPQDEIEFEIAVSVAKYIYVYMQERLEDPLDAISFHASTSDLFKQDRNRFTAAFLHIMEYWNIDLSEEKFTLIDKEFELFPTIESVCSFVEERVV